MGRRRFLISVVLAVILHGVIFLVLQLYVKQKQQMPQYSGPLFVSLEQVPAIATEALEPETPETAALEIEQPRETPVPEVAPDVDPEITTRVAPESVVTPEREALPADMQPPGEPPDSAVPPEREKSVPRPELLQPRLPPAAAPSDFREDFREPFESGAPALKPLPRRESVPDTDRPEEEYDPLPPEQEGLFLQPPSKIERPGPEESAEGESSLIPLELDQELARLDEEIAAADARADENADSAAGTEGDRTGETGRAAEPGRPGEGLRIQWDDPKQGRDPLNTPDPVVPAWVSDQGLRLKVSVDFQLTPQGFLSDVRIIESSGYPDVDTAVLETLRRWTFKPVKSLLSVTGRITYSIQPR